MLIDRLKHKEFVTYHSTAVVAAILANVNRDSKKRPEPFSELDFIPGYLMPPGLRRKGFRDLSPMEQRKALARVFGFTVGSDGKVVKKR